MSGRDGMGLQARHTSSPYDVLVIGSGIAGCVTALTAAPRARVAVVTAGELVSGCTAWAQGGIAAAIGADDSPELHAADTLAAGRGLCREAAVTVLVSEAGERIRDLENWGVVFDRGEDGAIALGREAAHSCNRIVHAGGDATGARVEAALTERVRGSGADIFENHVVLELILDAGGRCTGALVADTRSGETAVLAASSVILATGGAGHLWTTTTNPAGIAGSGVALAYAAGATVESMEFMQFHPTALALDGAPHFLISEAVRGEGAHLVNEAGRRFTLDSDPRGELAPRDVVAQSIWAELATGGAASVYLDCTPIGERVAARFPSIHAALLGWGIDMRRDRIPVAPAAHYMIGGVRTDLDGATDVPGLYACGEVASTGVHGANRLASNSLLEGIVYGRRAADAALRRQGEMPPPRLSAETSRVGMGGNGTHAALDRLRDAMWRGAGITRDAAGLQAARNIAAEVAQAPGDGLGDRSLRAAATAATLVLDSALFREESRGAHLRVDHPTSTDQWHGVIAMRRDEKGARLDRHA